MDELGVQLIFAQSPQAKGRVERAAGTFQDRLVTELRLAGATTIDDANRVLEGFLPRFNGRFKVPARESEVAYRAVDEGDVRLEKCPVLQVQAQSRQGQHGQIPLAHTSTAARHGPAELRRSSCGCARRTGRYAWQCSTRDAIIPSQEAPPRPSVLRGFAGRTTHSPIIHQPTNGLGSKWAAKLATLDANHDAEQPVATSGRDGAGRVRKTVTSTAQEAHAAADGQVEGGAEGEAKGTVHAWDRPGAGYTQRHGEKVHERREPTCGAISTDAEWPMI